MPKNIRKVEPAERLRARVVADFTKDGVTYRAGEVIEAVDLIAQAEAGEVDLHADAVEYALSVGAVVRAHKPSAEA